MNDLAEPAGAPHGGLIPVDARRQPMHARILDELRGAIRAGAFGVGEPLPSEQDLGARFAASRITVRHALQQLQAEGYVRKQHGRRTVVVSREPRRPVWQMETVEDLIASAGGASLDILAYRKVVAADAAEALGLEPDAPLYSLQSLLKRDGTPYARSLIYFPEAIGSRLRLADFDDVIVFRVLQRHFGIELADVTMTVRAARAEPEDMRLLGCKRGDPMLLTQLVYRPDPAAAPVEAAFTRFPAETYSLSYSLTGHQPRT
jgi:GntR family transcriptional regulator